MEILDHAISVCSEKLNGTVAAVKVQGHQTQIDELWPKVGDGMIRRRVGFV